MAQPETVARFLRGKRFAVAGVSRTPAQAANAIYRKLRAAGFDVVPVNPNAKEVEGVECYPDISSVPGSIDGLLIASHPSVAADLVRQAHARDIDQVWFHRSFGTGSVSEEALRVCSELGIAPIVGGCPLMYCRPVDIPHRCIRWWLTLRHRVPA